MKKIGVRNTAGLVCHAAVTDLVEKGSGGPGPETHLHTLPCRIFSLKLYTCLPEAAGSWDRLMVIVVPFPNSDSTSMVP